MICSSAGYNTIDKARTTLFQYLLKQFNISLFTAEVSLVFDKLVISVFNVIQLLRIIQRNRCVTFKTITNVILL